MYNVVIRGLIKYKLYRHNIYIYSKSVKEIPKKYFSTYTICICVLFCYLVGISLNPFKSNLFVAIAYKIQHIHRRQSGLLLIPP